MQAGSLKLDGNIKLLCSNYLSPSSCMYHKASLDRPQKNVISDQNLNWPSKGLKIFPDPVRLHPSDPSVPQGCPAVSGRGDRPPPAPPAAAKSLPGALTERARHVLDAAGHALTPWVALYSPGLRQCSSQFTPELRPVQRRRAAAWDLMGAVRLGGMIGNTDCSARW